VESRLPVDVRRLNSPEMHVTDKVWNHREYLIMELAIAAVVFGTVFILFTKEVFSS